MSRSGKSDTVVRTALSCYGITGYIKNLIRYYCRQSPPLLGGVMSLLSGSRGGRIARWLPFAVVALVGALGAAATYYVAAETDDARIRGAMELRAEWRALDFERKLRILANPV